MDNNTFTTTDSKLGKLVVPSHGDDEDTGAAKSNDTFHSVLLITNNGILINSWHIRYNFDAANKRIMNTFQIIKRMKERTQISSIVLRGNI